jgi:hypothetical protein
VVGERIVTLSAFPTLNSAVKTLCRHILNRWSAELPGDNPPQRQCARLRIACASMIRIANRAQFSAGDRLDRLFGIRQSRPADPRLGPHRTAESRPPLCGDK